MTFLIYYIVLDVRTFILNLINFFLKQFDFNELEKATEYEGGYTDKSQTIIDFWEIVHALPMESKKKLLEFTTGNQ